MPDVPPMQFKPTGDPMERFVRYIRELNAPIPKTVPVGMHLCYGDLHHKHFKDPADLATSVRMANKAAEVSPRPISHVQMAVPRHRSDDKYFEPLQDLKIGDATVYAGLVHYTDGVEGSKKRLEAFQRHFKGPTGVATECGLGRRPKDQQLTKLLEIHRDVAAAIRG
jgi:methionine synthase II (cobalamin-independent)